MSDGIYVALSGAIAQTTQLDVTATNLANASTDGYQRLRPVFREALNGADAKLRYTDITHTALDTTVGAMRVTGRPLDVVLPQGSYLAVQTSRGERYTRGGSLNVAADGTLQTKHGEAVLGENGDPIKAPLVGGEVKISPSGEVWHSSGMVGRVKLVTFQDPSALSQEGATTLAATQASGDATASKGQLEIGSLEESNASVVSAMTDLVTTSRTFEAFQRAIDTFRQADQKVATTVAGDQ